MPIITRAKARTILQIKDSDSPYDDVIDELIPAIQDWIVEYCNNNFLDDRVEYSGSTFSFATNTITDSESGFSDEGFTSNDDIYVAGTDGNDGHYHVNTAAAGTLTLSTSTLVTESAGDYVTITRVIWPQGVQLAAAKMIMYDIKRMNQMGIASETKGDYSVQFAVMKNQGYPDSILGMLIPYRYMKCR